MTRPGAVTDPLDRVLAALRAAQAPSSDYDLNPGVVLPEGRKLRAASSASREQRPSTRGHGTGPERRRALDRSGLSE